ncbi:hypothetical protein [Streptacidiphilus rugosus]|uniref:hypothetical protein n=1 Tax=Streptacidiphilus rugosus TaxID=405783 RepID=UPI000569C81E|nr:hypothetical protein [Streptacidiphilus rugosus]
MTQPRDDAGLAQGGEAEGPEWDAEDDDVADWMLVRPDGRALVAPLVRSAPLIALAALRVGLLLARGRGSSQGLGWVGLSAGLVLVVLPLLWVVLHIGLRWLNSTIQVEEGELTIRNPLGRRVLQVPVGSVTGLHNVTLPQQGPGRHRVVLTFTAGKPRIIQPRLWDAAALGELWRALGLPFTDQGTLSWKKLVQRFPGAKVPWWNLHAGLAAVLGTVLAIAYIAVMVNLAYLV